MLGVEGVVLVPGAVLDVRDVHELDVGAEGRRPAHAVALVPVPGLFEWKIYESTGARGLSFSCLPAKHFGKIARISAKFLHSFAPFTGILKSVIRIPEILQNSEKNP